MPKVKSRTIESIRDAVKATKRSAAGSLVRIRDEGINVRLMNEPDGGWVEFKEHYVEEGPDKGYRPCTEPCDYCDNGDTPTKRFLVNAINLDDNNKVVPLVIPTSVAASLLNKYKIFGTIIDRDYTLTREGMGRDTEYEATPDGPRPMNLKRYKPIELRPLLQSIVDGDDADEDDDTEDEEVTTPRRIAKRPVAKDEPRRVAKKAAPAEPRRAVKKAAAPEPRRVVRKATGKPIRRA